MRVHCNWRAAAVLMLAIFSNAMPVHAQDGTMESPAKATVSAGWKGTVGLGLLGGELGLVLTPAVGIDSGWARAVVATLGAGGGAAAGYFLLDSTFKQGDDATLPVASLAAGMALVIPAVMLSISLSAYDPGDEMPGLERAGGGILQLARLGNPERASVTLSVPVIEAQPAFSGLPAGQGVLGVPGLERVSVPLLSGSF